MVNNAALRRHWLLNENLRTRNRLRSYELAPEAREQRPLLLLFMAVHRKYMARHCYRRYHILQSQDIEKLILN